MRVKYVIIGLLLLSLAIKIHPPLTHDYLVNFDSIYHARIGQVVAETGWVPSWDYVAGGRPHLYPPLYHLTLGYSSIVSGIPVIELVRYVLPLVSALLMLPVFFLIKKYRGVEAALLGAAFTALNPIIAAQSYDSPQLFGLLLFPLIIYAFLKGKYLIGGGLLAVCMLFNYFITLTIVTVLVVFALVKLIKGKRLPILYAALITAIGVGLVSPWLLVSFSRSGECFDPSTAVSPVTEAGIQYLLFMAPFIAILGFGLLYWLKNREDDYTLLWRVALGLGTVGFLVSLAIPQLHPYDQLLLFGFSMCFILPELKLNKKYIATVLALMLVVSLSTVASVKPALSEGDQDAVYWVRDHVVEGTVLANPEVSGMINTLTMSRSIRTEFDLFLECIPDSTRWSDMYRALQTNDLEEARSILGKYGVDYAVVGARDVWNYGFDIGKFESLGSLVFSSHGSRIYRIG